MAQRGTAQHTTAMTQRGAAQQRHSTAQHATAWHSAGGTAQQRTAQRSSRAGSRLGCPRNDPGELEGACSHRHKHTRARAHTHTRALTRRHTRSHAFHATPHCRAMQARTITFNGSPVRLVKRSASVSAAAATIQIPTQSSAAPPMLVRAKYLASPNTHRTRTRRQGGGRRHHQRQRARDAQCPQLRLHHSESLVPRIQLEPMARRSSEWWGGVVRPKNWANPGRFWPVLIVIPAPPHPHHHATPRHATPRHAQRSAESSSTYVRDEGPRVPAGGDAQHVAREDPH
jgi:hypothetical protein